MNTWILGKYYYHPPGSDNTDATEKEIVAHAASFYRFTYRRDFPPLFPYPQTSDAGWGCMLRSAQMLIGYAMLRHYLGPDWRNPNALDKLKLYKEYCEITKWFVDYPGYPHIYSLHHLIQCGMKYDKLPGEWYGPSTAALVLRDLAKLHRWKYHGPLEIMVTQGDTIYISEAERICSNQLLDEKMIASFRNNSLLLSPCPSNPAKGSSHKDSQSIEPSIEPPSISIKLTSQDEEKSHLTDSSHPLMIDPSTSDQSQSEGIPHRPIDPLSAFFFDPLLRPPPSAVAPWSHALVVMMPLRLGIHHVNEEYIEELKEVLRNKYCIGILGGRPGHAIYFVGYSSNASSDKPAVRVSPATKRSQSKRHQKVDPDNRSDPNPIAKGRCTLLGFDPHTVYPNPDIPSPPPVDSTHDPTSKSTIDQMTSAFPTPEFVSQVHVKEFAQLDINSLDPSLALAFYFADRQEFESFCNEQRIISERKRKEGIYNLYNIEHTAPSFVNEAMWREQNAVEDDQMKAKAMSSYSDLDLNEPNDNDDKDDDYVFL